MKTLEEELAHAVRSLMIEFGLDTLNVQAGHGINGPILLSAVEVPAVEAA